MHFFQSKFGCVSLETSYVRYSFKLCVFLVSAKKNPSKGTKGAFAGRVRKSVGQKMPRPVKEEHVETELAQEEEEEEEEEDGPTAGLKAGIELIILSPFLKTVFLFTSLDSWSSGMMAVKFILKQCLV